MFHRDRCIEGGFEPIRMTEELVRLIGERFGTTVHPRSIERRLRRHQKKRR